jgi:hypothetical protein
MPTLVLTKDDLAGAGILNTIEIPGSGGGGGGTDADVTAFLTAASISDNTIETSLNTFVTTLKNEGLWDKLQICYPFVTDKTDSADIQSQFKFNLKDPQDTDAAYRLTTNGSVTFNTTGIVTGDAGGYLDTHVTIYDGGAGGSSISMWHNGIQIQGYWNTSAQIRNYQNSGDVSALGTHVIGRLDNNTLVYATPNLYKTGTTIGGGGDFEDANIAEVDGGIYYDGMSVYYLRTNSDTSWQVTDERYIGRRFFSPAYSTNELSLYAIIDAINNSQTLTLQNAVNQLQTDLGRATH